MTRSDSTRPPTRPQGRDEIRAAVLGSARTLLAERGPEGFSVRDIAAAAGVNHALVHRHFGTKAEVLEQVLAEEASAVATAVAAWSATRSTSAGETPDVAALLTVLAEFPSYWRTLAHTVLEAPGAAVPGSDATTAPFRALWQTPEGTDPERAAATATAGATALGWLVFGAFMADVTGAEPDAVRRIAAEQVRDLTGRG